MASMPTNITSNEKFKNGEYRDAIKSIGDKIGIVCECTCPLVVMYCEGFVVFTCKLHCLQTCECRSKHQSLAECKA